MGGIFGVASKQDCVTDLFFGVDYHSHLGTKRGGMATYSADRGFDRAIHNIGNSPFRTKFQSDVNKMSGTLGIGCISDTDPQPLIVRSHFGRFALTTVGRINNKEELVDRIFFDRKGHFMEMSGGNVNGTELVAALISTQNSFLEGIRYVQEVIEGSLSMLVMTPEGIYAARDKLGRMPLLLGKKEDACCATFESFAYHNLGYQFAYELGPAEIVYFNADGFQSVSPPGEEMRICAFLWTYYGYPTSTYEGVNVEEMRYRCGQALADLDQDDLQLDGVAGVPDSGTAHAIGYANRSGVPFTRPLIKYTPTWPRSFMPPNQSTRNLVARMKLIPIEALIRDKRLLFIDDSVVRGTQMRETVEYLYEAGAKEVHVRPACPPIMFGCKYLNFSRSTSEMDLITHQVMQSLEGDGYLAHLDEYVDQTTERHHKMVECIAKRLNFTSLRYHELNEMLDSIGIDRCKICTYCWNGKE